MQKKEAPKVEGAQAHLPRLYPHRRDEGTEQTLAAVTTSDHKRLLARGNCHRRGGAIDADALKCDLDQMFSGLPAEPSLMPSLKPRRSWGTKFATRCSALAAWSRLLQL
ncbi:MULTISPECIES: hypothetical protein [Rhizobium]|uniref:Uncharacterized protein n=2 Tax=Rhizobium TaxID=379 RepID=A0A7W6RR39_9HYPH|nr:MULTISPECIES: hypothetical protein [Rhizobium]MBB4276526.1 hypothetical protein [Rhizobium mongolense]TCU33030.1 hypothetical protein EV129_11727 [Rhizobium azibense]